MLVKNLAPAGLQSPTPEMAAHAVSRLSGFRRLTSCTFLRRHCSAPGECDISSKDAAVNSQLKALNIYHHTYIKGGQFRSVCPKCSGGINGGNSLAVNILLDGKFAGWSCFRRSCSYNGHAGLEESTALKAVSKKGGDEMLVKDASENGSSEAQKEEASASISRKFSSFHDPCEEVLYYFEKREISRKTLERNRIKETASKDGSAIVFPYIMSGQVVNCKYRTLGKKFWQEKQPFRVFYGLDDIISASEIIIVEGEIDKLAMEEAGFLNCVSVPDGAPAKIFETTPVTEAEDKKFSYIWNCREYFEKASRIILATDADEPGQALAVELARRLGRERCWRVQWPKTKDWKRVCKDANEVLMELGVEALQTVVETAEFYPIQGLFTFDEFFEDLDKYFRNQGSDETGVSTGWPSLDNFYKVVPGELTLVTGVPGSGKSEWIDALMCNLVQLRGWNFGLCSMENKVREHGRKLLEKYLKKPFFQAAYSGKKERISPEELEHGKRWINDNFYLIRCEDDELPSIDWVLQLARAAVMRHGIRGLVIDPYNELDHQRSSHQTETEYVSKMLTKIKRFAQHHSCHVWFVAHPRQMQSWQGEAPNLYDISGSAHFVNKCDNGLIVHRNRDPTKGPLDRVEILVRKARNKVAGALGGAFLSYDRVTGLYTDAEQTPT